MNQVLRDRINMVDIMGKLIDSKVNREEIASLEELAAIIGNSFPGDEISLTILRDGKTLRVDVTLGEFSG